METIAARPGLEPPVFSIARDEVVPPLEDYASAQFYRLLANPQREAFWAALVRIYQRKFLAATVALTRPEAIDLAERVLEGLTTPEVDFTKVDWEEGRRLSDLEDDAPSDGPLREPARRLVRVLADAGWVYFQTYPEERYPVLELTRVGQLQVAHMLRGMQGQQLPLISFADRLGGLVGSRCSAMRTTAGRLPQLREVVAQLNERIHELLAGIKKQSEGAIVRNRSIRAILSDLLVAFERRVGYEYAVLKRRESPPRLWAAVMQAVHDLREDTIWLHREGEWYREQYAPDDFEAAMRAVGDDLAWIAQVMDNLSHANELLDRRYSRYVSQAKRRIEGQLRQSINMADGLTALLEAAATGDVTLPPVRVSHVLGIGPVGFTFSRKERTVAAQSPVPDLEDMSEAEARRYRELMDDSIPLAEIRHWLGAREGEAAVVNVDDLPLNDEADYLCHLFAGFYASQRKHGLRFEPSGCSTGGCTSPKTCTTCTRRANGFGVPRGRFVVTPARSTA